LDDEFKGDFVRGFCMGMGFLNGVLKGCFEEVLKWGFCMGILDGVFKWYF